MGLNEVAGCEACNADEVELVYDMLGMEGDNSNSESCFDETKLN